MSVDLEMPIKRCMEGKEGSFSAQSSKRYEGLKRAVDMGKWAGWGWGREAEAKSLWWMEQRRGYIASGTYASGVLSLEWSFFWQKNSPGSHASVGENEKKGIERGEDMEESSIAHELDFSVLQTLGEVSRMSRREKRTGWDIWMSESKRSEHMLSLFFYRSLICLDTWYREKERTS